MTQPAAFLQEMEQIAVAAQADEIAFRKSMAATLAGHERARQYAFRRLTVATAMARAACAAETEEDRSACALAALYREFGWLAATERRQRIGAAAAPLALAIVQAARPREQGEAPADCRAVTAAFAAFEAWYEAENGAPLLAALDQDIPDMPLVEV
jgi:hypothetical protein